MNIAEFDRLIDEVVDGPIDDAVGAMGICQSIRWRMHESGFRRLASEQITEDLPGYMVISGLPPDDLLHGASEEQTLEDTNRAGMVNDIAEAITTYYLRRTVLSERIDLIDRSLTQLDLQHLYAEKSPFEIPHPNLKREIVLEGIDTFIRDLINHVVSEVFIAKEWEPLKNNHTFVEKVVAERLLGDIRDINKGIRFTVSDEELMAGVGKDPLEEDEPWLDV